MHGDRESQEAVRLDDASSHGYRGAARGRGLPDRVVHRPHRHSQAIGTPLIVRRSISSCRKTTGRRTVPDCDKSMIRWEKPAAG
ncbi:hypothetical protein L665_00923 [Ralstonia solanacearum SD54]|nr:alkyl hydroperoxide reductase [Ralstonia solanacearum]ESS50563.1 hypothetical protein L665_00923 [Ralstonia solanacearum SD54]